MSSPEAWRLFSWKSVHIPIITTTLSQRATRSGARATMNEEDRRMQLDERDASPERFSSQAARPEVVEEIEPPTGKEKQEQLSRQLTASSSSRSSVGSIRRPSNAVSRMTTQHEIGDLERHPTALSRIQTGRSQHSHTIGTGIRSRTSTRQSKKPMPNFGAGKPFPPPLPEREEYVVEFDGPTGSLTNSALYHKRCMQYWKKADGS